MSDLISNPVRKFTKTKQNAADTAGVKGRGKYGTVSIRKLNNWLETSKRVSFNLLFDSTRFVSQKFLVNNSNPLPINKM